MHIVRPLVALLVALPLGCVLLVSPPDVGEHCHFANEDSACGACVRAHCQARIDACCSDDAECHATLAVVEACSAGNTSAWNDLLSDLAAARPSRATLATCVHNECEFACRATSSKRATRCTVPAYGDHRTCSCFSSEPTNEVDCSEALLPGTLCCAPEAWPAPGLQCSCSVLSCDATSDGCFCILFDQAIETKCETATCCQDAETCRCGTKACAPGSRQVPSCSIQFMQCARGQKRVASCSVAK